MAFLDKEAGPYQAVAPLQVHPEAIVAGEEFQLARKQRTMLRAYRAATDPIGYKSNRPVFYKRLMKLQPKKQMVTYELNAPTWGKAAEYTSISTMKPFEDFPGAGLSGADDYEGLPSHVKARLLQLLADADKAVIRIGKSYSPWARDEAVARTRAFRNYIVGNVSHNHPSYVKFREHGVFLFERIGKLYQQNTPLDSVTVAMWKKFKSGMEKDLREGIPKLGIGLGVVAVIAIGAGLFFKAKGSKKLF